MSKIHHTRGVYLNGEYKDNAVLHEHLESHIAYNKLYRFGRALLVDGVIVYNGYLSDADLAPHVGVVNNYTRCSAPYH
jgi:hypothetical protein